MSNVDSEKVVSRYSCSRLLPLIIGLVALHPSPALSQTVGVAAGAGVTRPALGGRDARGDITAARKTGLLVGAFATIPIASPRVAVQPEVLFAQRHWDIIDPNEYTATEAWDFIEVPILLRVNFEDAMYRASTPGVFVVVGPAFTARARYRELKLEEAGTYRRVPVDLEAVTRGRDVRIVGGIGVTMGQRFEIEFRYDRGLSNLNTVPGLDPDDSDLSIREQSFGVIARWSFR